MKFRIRNWYWRGSAPEMTISELIAHEADQTDHDGGKLEDLERSIKALTRMVAVLVDNLPPHVQVKIASDLGADPVEGS